MNTNIPESHFKDLAKEINKTYNYAWINDQEKAKEFENRNKTSITHFEMLFNQAYKGKSITFENKEGKEKEFTLNAIKFNANYMNYDVFFKHGSDNYIRFNKELKTTKPTFQESSMKTELKQQGLELTQNSENFIEKILQYSEYS